MLSSRTYRISFVLLALALLCALLLNISSGSVSIPFSDVLSLLWGKTPEIVSWEYIVSALSQPLLVTWDGLAVNIDVYYVCSGFGTE